MGSIPKLTPPAIVCASLRLSRVIDGWCIMLKCLNVNCAKGKGGGSRKSGGANAPLNFLLNVLAKNQFDH